MNSTTWGIKPTLYGNYKNRTQASGKGPDDWFTESVRIDPLFQPNKHRYAAAARVSFEPGARTA